MNSVRIAPHWNDEILGLSVLILSYFSMQAAKNKRRQKRHALYMLLKYNDVIHFRVRRL
jgi:hypothetical protein